MSVHDCSHVWIKGNRCIWCEKCKRDFLDWATRQPRTPELLEKVEAAWHMMMEDWERYGVSEENDEATEQEKFSERHARAS